MQIPLDSKCKNNGEYLLFSNTKNQVAEWSQAFQIAPKKVRMRFKIRWEPHTVSKTLGVYPFNFRIYGPTQYAIGSKYVLVKVVYEVISSDGGHHRTDFGWSKYLPKKYLYTQQTYIIFASRQETSP